MRRYSIGWQNPAQDGHVRFVLRDTRSGPIVEEVHVIGRVDLAWFRSLEPEVAVTEMRAEARKEGRAA